MTHATRRLVLASGSRYRAAVLARLGLPFEAASPGVDEDAVKALGLPPRDLVRRLAREKAQALSADYPDALILGGDQAASLDGDILDKPGGVDLAVAQLKRLSGRTHELLTAIALHDAASGETRDRVVVHRLTMRALPEASLRRYVERDMPTDCAGSYKLESLGIALFERIEGGDDSGIQGLPLVELCGLLAEFSVQVL